MNFTPEEIKKLEESEVYQYYKNINWQAITYAIVEADLDAIKTVSVDTLPLIKFLTMILQSKQLESQLDTQLAINSSNTGIESYTFAAVKDLWNTTFAQSPTVLTDLAWHRTTHTLSSGALSATDLYDPGSGYKFYSYWIILGSANVTNPNSTYNDVLITDESNNEVINRIQVSGLDFGRTRYPLFYKADTANKALQITWDNGNGGEVVYAAVMVGKYTV